MSKREYIRPRKHKPRKEFDFVPNKEQIIRGAFYDLGKPLDEERDKRYANIIASIWNEEI